MWLSITELILAALPFLLIAFALGWNLRGDKERKRREWEYGKQYEGET